MRSILLALLILIFGCANIAAQDTDDSQKVVLKAGTEFSATIKDAIDSGNAAPGADLSFKLVSDLSGNGINFSAGTEIIGRVIAVVKYSSENKVSKVKIRFDFFKNGDDYFGITASVISIKDMTDDIKFDHSTTFDGNTELSLKGKDMVIPADGEFRIHLTKDVISY